VLINTRKAAEKSSADSNSLPELAPRWKKLDLAEIFSRPAGALNELVDELKALVQPGDLQFNELALQSSFIGTQLPLESRENGSRLLC
jgi:hypothetical protein